MEMVEKISLRIQLQKLQIQSDESGASAQMVKVAPMEAIEQRKSFDQKNVRGTDSNLRKREQIKRAVGLAKICRLLTYI